jgi:hypothetical protein
MGKKEEFFGFITVENYKYQFDIWYRSNNISREKIELFHDFVISLYETINQTYLGPDVMDNWEDQQGHFTWSWDKVLTTFTKEKIHFRERGVHYEYFWNFFLEAYYYTQIDNLTIKIPEYFDKLFGFNHIKPTSELEVLAEIYKILDQNLKK